MHAVLTCYLNACCQKEQKNHFWQSVWLLIDAAAIYPAVLQFLALEDLQLFETLLNC